MPICLLQLKVQMKGLSFQYYCCSTSWWNWFVMQITWVVWWQWLSSFLILAVSTAKIYCGIGAHKIEMIFWNFCNTEIIFFLMFCTILAVAAWSMVESAPLLWAYGSPLAPLSKPSERTRPPTHDDTLTATQVRTSPYAISFMPWVQFFCVSRLLS
jgi:hypothetical protein